MGSVDPDERLRSRSPAEPQSSPRTAPSLLDRPAGELRPPKSIIDLSLPPEQRYVHLVPYFQPAFSALPSLFSELLGDFGLPEKWTTRFARLLLRRVGSHEETRELRGLSRATDIPMHLLVAFNVLLDLFMGCTSGGVRVRDEGAPVDSAAGARMLHFRTLDWGMDPLRQLVVELEFVRRTGGPVIATSITYFGYVGVLTGVRDGLSLSLNFRPSHDRRTLAKRVQFRWQQLMVLLGFRNSIATTLRGILLDGGKSDRVGPLTGRAKEVAYGTSALDVAAALENQPCTACYLTLCDGKTTVTVEKDHCAATVQSAKDFIVVLNHDEKDEASVEPPQDTCDASKEQAETNVEPAGDIKPQDSATSKDNGSNKDEVLAVTGMEGIVEFSVERKRCFVALWERDKCEAHDPNGDQKDASTSGSSVTPETVMRWMKDGDEIVNLETHFGVIMDPSTGKIVWLERYLEPPEENSSIWTQEEQGEHANSDSDQDR